jgi:capsid protein
MVHGYFEALRPSSDRTPMVAAALQLQMRGGAMGMDRVQLAALSRALYDNGGFVGYAVNQIALCSTPVIPQAASDNDGWNQRAEAWFAEWSRKCDFVGRAEYDLWAIQTVISHAIDLDGDIGVALTGAGGFPQIQLIEGWRIGSGVRNDDGRSKDGVILDPLGRVRGYAIEEDGRDTELAAGEMILLRDPSIVSPLRGLSPLRRGMNDIRDARDIMAFEKLAVKQNSAFVGVLEGKFMEDGHGFDLSGGAPPSPLAPASEDEPPPEPTEGEKSLSRADLLGGDIPVLEDGQTFKRVESNRPNANFGEFLNSLVALFSAGLDIPPAYFLDQKLTGPNQRAVIAKAQRKFDHRQTVMCRLMEWLWARVIGWAIDTGQLPAVDGWWRLTFQRPARMTIDAGREAQQEREDQGRGLMTRQDHFGGRGKDWQRETDQCFAEDSYVIERAKKLSERTGVPLVTILARYGFEQKASQAAPPGGETPRQDEEDEEEKPGE